jgi:hypothetical protein
MKPAVGSHGSEEAEYCLLGCDAVLFGVLVPIF